MRSTEWEYMMDNLTVVTDERRERLINRLIARGLSMADAEDEARSWFQLLVDFESSQQ